MAKLQRILVALDFSDCSWDVADHALTLAKGLGASVVLVHVNDLPQGVDQHTPMANEAGQQVEAGRYLHSAASVSIAGYEKLFASKGVEVEVDLPSGPIAESIIESAEKYDADMIVMGTHGRRGMSRLLSGSIAEKVSRLANCPVTTLRTQYKASCKAHSCNWCDSHISKEQRRVAAEADG